MGSTAVKGFSVAVFVTVAVNCIGSEPASTPGDEWSLDQRSYNLGSVGAFAEMVGAGVKELALSSPLTADEMDEFLPHALEIANRHGVEIYRETDFLVTDLFASSLTDGLEVLFIYRGDTLERYSALKQQKLRLEEQGAYVGEARRDVAANFGRMLSYTNERIEELLSSR